MGDSHSDGEMVTSNRTSLLDLKPKHKLSFIDCDEPKIPKQRSSPRRKQNSISFSIMIEDPSKGVAREELGDDDDDSESDATWYPP
jgi:ATP-dependent Lon protease